MKITMTTDETHIEYIFEKALHHYERGVSVSTIINTFPQYAKELHEMFDAMEVLRGEGKRIHPSRALLMNIIERVSEISHVSHVATERSKMKSRMFFRFAMPVGVLAVAMFVILSQLSTPSGPQSVALREFPDPVSADFPAKPATGSIDDIVDAMFADALNDQIAFAYENTELSITGDRTTLTNVADFYDEHDF